MGGFDLLEHTADTGIFVYGDSLEEALSWLATGMFSLIVDPETVASSSSQTIILASSDREALAVDWLKELVYLYETTGFLLKDCRVTLSQGGTQLEALCHGEPVDLTRHRILTAIKAATYHRLEVSHETWNIRVFLDV